MLASSKSFSLRARTTSAPRTARRACLVRASADVQTETATPEVAPKPGFKDVMGFGGWAPETINGRLAMLGFIAGVGCELGTGETLPVQFGEHFGIFAAHSLVFALQRNHARVSCPRLLDKCALVARRHRVLGAGRVVCDCLRLVCDSLA